MKLILIVLGLVFLFIYMNYVYLYKVNYNSQDNLILNGKKGQWDYIAIGSTYGRYGIDFNAVGCKGWNFCFAPQFLYYTEKILYSYSRYFKANCIVIITLPDLVFISEGRYDYGGSNRYHRILDRESLGEDFSCKRWLFSRLPLLENPKLIKEFFKFLVGKRSHDRYEISKNLYEPSQWDELAKSRCLEWCNQFGLKDTYDGDFTGKIREEFQKSVAVLERMINFCLKERYRPILVVPPLSEAMNKNTSFFFLKNVLYDNINTANTANIPVLDYRKDSRLQDMNLYINADFLNLTGREKFTRILMSDISNIYSQ